MGIDLINIWIDCLFLMVFDANDTKKIDACLLKVKLDFLSLGTFNNINKN